MTAPVRSIGGASACSSVTLRRKLRSRFDLALAYNDCVPAYGGGGKAPVPDRQREPDQARSPHLVSLLDGELVITVRRMLEVQVNSGKCGGSSTSCGIFRHTQAWREHAGMKRRSGFDGLAAKQIRYAWLVLTERCVPLGHVCLASSDGFESPYGNEDYWNSRRPTRGLEGIKPDILSVQSQCRCKCFRVGGLPDLFANEAPFGEHIEREAPSRDRRRNWVCLAPLRRRLLSLPSCLRADRSAGRAGSAGVQPCIMKHL